MTRDQYQETDGRSGDAVRPAVATLVLALLIPGLLFAGWYANSWAASERTQIEQGARHSVHGMMSALDRHLVSTQNTLTALASSPLLQTGDIRAFYHQAVQVAQSLQIQILLRDAQRNTYLFHTASPYGAESLSGVSIVVDMATHRLLDSKKPAVTGVIFGRRSKEYLVVVLAPVMRQDTVRYVLSVVVPVKTIARILGQFQQDPSWIASVVDQHGYTVARTKFHEEAAGMPAARRWRDAPPKGTLATQTRAGEPALLFFQRSDVTGWLVTLEVPESVLAAPSRLVLFKFATAGLVFLLAGGMIAHRFAGRITNKMGALQTAAIVERQASEEQFQALAESVSNGIVAVDSDGHIVYLNAQIERMFGYGRDELIGQPVEVLLPKRLRSDHVGYRAAYEGAPRMRSMGAGQDLWALRKDGTEFPIKVGLNPIRTTTGNLVVATMVDLTARKQAAERLALTLSERDTLRRRLMQAQEQERLRLARDLHDQTGQVVAALMMELKGIEAYIDQRGRTRIRNLRGQLDKMGKALHRIAWELRPASIDEIGLAAALAEYVAEWESQFGIPAEFYCNKKLFDRLSDEVGTTVYRIVQEALTNVAKHARGATAVSVIVDFSGAGLRLTIEDNGCGFADDHSPGSRKGHGLGLAGMRERLSLIGGVLEIESSADVGTTLFIRIPLEQERLIA